MTLGQLFDLMLETWKVKLTSRNNEMDFIDFSNSHQFEPYLDREIAFIGRGSYGADGQCMHEMQIVLK